MASTSDAVAKPAFLSWQTWDPYDRPTEPVSVSLRLERELRRHQVPREGHDRADGQGRAEALALLARDHARRLHRPGLGRGPPARRGAEQREQIDAEGPLLPEAAPRRRELDPPGRSRSRRSGDTHLLASAQPVRWQPGTEAPVADAERRRRRRPDALRRDQRYSVWSYAPTSEPERAERSSAATTRPRPSATSRSSTEPVPEWGTPNRDTLMTRLLRRAPDEFGITALESVYQAALGVDEQAQSPVRGRGAPRDLVPRSRGASRYDEQPPAAGRRRAAARRLRAHGRSAATASTTRERWRSCSAARRPRPGRRRLYERRVRQADDKEWVGQGHQRPRLGRGLVPRVRLDSRSTRPRGAAS